LGFEVNLALAGSDNCPLIYDFFPARLVGPSFASGADVDGTLATGLSGHAAYAARSQRIWTRHVLHVLVQRAGIDQRAPGSPLPIHHSRISKNEFVELRGETIWVDDLNSINRNANISILSPRQLAAESTGAISIVGADSDRGGAFGSDWVRRVTKPREERHTSVLWGQTVQSLSVSVSHQRNPCLRP